MRLESFTPKDQMHTAAGQMLQTQDRQTMGVELTWSSMAQMTTLLKQGTVAVLRSATSGRKSSDQTTAQSGAM